jgi:hypothetical protein
MNVHDQSTSGINATPLVGIGVIRGISGRP